MVAHVGHHPEERGLVVHNVGHAQTNIHEPAFFVADWSEKILEGGVSTKASQTDHRLRRFLAHRAHSSVTVARWPMDRPLPVSTLIGRSHRCARVASLPEDATSNLEVVWILVGTPVGEVERLPGVVVRPNSVLVRPVRTPVEDAASWHFPFQFPFVIGLQLHGSVPVVVEQLVQGGLVLVSRDLAPVHLLAKAQVVVEMASLSVDEPEDFLGVRSHDLP